MTVARKVVPGETYLLTRRCTQRQFLLRPDKTVIQIYLYVFAVAVERYGMTAHGCLGMSNHKHDVVRDNLGKLDEFQTFFHALFAKAMNAHRKRWENVWSNEQASAVRLVEPADCFDKLVYLYANPINADLVDRVTDWPGVSTYEQSLTGKTITIKRPRIYFDKDGDMPEEITLTIVPPNGFEHLSQDEWATMLRAAVEAKEMTARERRLKDGRRIVGRKAVLKTCPTDAPTTAVPHRKLRPAIACKNKKRREHELSELLTFRIERKHALSRLNRGAKNVVFPYGTCRIRGVFITTPPPVMLAA